MLCLWQFYKLILYALSKGKEKKISADKILQKVTFNKFIYKAYFHQY